MILGTLSAQYEDGVNDKVKLTLRFSQEFLNFYQANKNAVFGLTIGWALASQYEVADYNQLAENSNISGLWLNVDKKEEIKSIIENKEWQVECPITLKVPIIYQCSVAFYGVLISNQDCLDEFGYDFCSTPVLTLTKQPDDLDYLQRIELAPLYKMMQQGKISLGEFGSDLVSSNFQWSITIDGANEYVINNNMDASGQPAFISVASKEPNYWFALQFITDTVVSYIGCNSMFAVAGPNGGDLVDQAQGIYNGATIPAGTIIYGKFTNIQIDSGIVMCYKNNPNAIITGLNY